MVKAGIVMSVAACGVAALTLSGCVSARDVQTTSSAAIATPSVDPADHCTLLDSDDLAEIIGTPFQPGPILDPASGDDEVMCQWTATSGLALVTTKETSGGNARTYYERTFAEAQRTLGPTEEARLPGTDEAFIAPLVGRTIMRVDDTVIEVNAVIPDTNPREMSSITELVARNATR